MVQGIKNKGNETEIEIIRDKQIFINNILSLGQSEISIYILKIQAVSSIGSSSPWANFAIRLGPSPRHLNSSSTIDPERGITEFPFTYRK